MWIKSIKNMPDTNLAILLDRFVRKMHASLHAKSPEFDTERIGPGGSIILLTLDELGEVSMNALTQALMRDKSQMTRAVGPLERKGMLQRSQSEHDARVTIISLTEKGQGMVKTLQSVIAETADDVLSPLSTSDKDAFRSLLERALAKT